MRSHSGLQMSTSEETQYDWRILITLVCALLGVGEQELFRVESNVRLHLALLFLM